MIEALALVLGIAVLALSAFCPARAARFIGAALFALIVFVVFRFSLGTTRAAVLAPVAGAAALRFLPGLVLRRLVFLVPALIVLIFATTLLMYRAPGNPFAHERATTPQVEAALRAQYGVPKNAPEFF